MTAWYTLSGAEGVDTPALVIYPDRVKKNLEIARSFVEDVAQLRPHVKTNKCPQVVRMMIDEGINKFKCATIAEAEMLATEKAKDVLLAYQPVAAKAARFCELQQKYRDTTFSCIVDNERSLRELSARAVSDNITVRVFIDLNVGMNRTGITPSQAAMDLYYLANNLEGIAFIGLHAYDGHLRDPDLSVRGKKCNDAFAPVDEMRQQIQRIGSKKPVIVAGGTPTFPIHAKRKDVEASPGTFIFWDKGYQQLLTEQPYEFAALVVTRVISVPDDRTVCLDLGHKSIASENALGNRVYLLNAPDLQPVGHSEEHMVFQSSNAHTYKTGDIFYGVPHHICPTVALYDEAITCQDNKITGSWQILSRKRKLTI